LRDCWSEAPGPLPAYRDAALDGPPGKLAQYRTVPGHATVARSRVGWNAVYAAVAMNVVDVAHAHDGQLPRRRVVVVVTKVPTCDHVPVERLPLCVLQFEVKEGRLVLLLCLLVSMLLLLSTSAGKWLPSTLRADKSLRSEYNTG
jgi:hypothetical protein